MFKSVNVSFKSLYSRPSFIKDSSSQVAHALTGHVPAYCPLQNLVLLLSWKSPSLRLNSKACLTNLQHSFFFRHIYYLQLTNFTLESGDVSLQQIALHSKISRHSIATFCCQNICYNVQQLLFSANMAKIMIILIKAGKQNQDSA